MLESKGSYQVTKLDMLILHPVGPYDELEGSLRWGPQHSFLGNSNFLIGRFASEFHFTSESFICSCRGAHESGQHEPVTCPEPA